MAAFGIDQDAIDTIRAFSGHAEEALEAIREAQASCRDPLMRRKLGSLYAAAVAAGECSDMVVSTWDVEADPATHADLERDRRLAEGRL